MRQVFCLMAVEILSPVMIYYVPHRGVGMSIVMDIAGYSISLPNTRFRTFSLRNDLL